MITRRHRSMADASRGASLTEILLVIIAVELFAVIGLTMFASDSDPAPTAAPTTAEATNSVGTAPATDEEKLQDLANSMRNDLKNAAAAVEMFITEAPTSKEPITVDDLVASGLQVSPGNEVTVNGTPIAGYNVCVNVKTIPDTYMVYSSNNGGLQSMMSPTCPPL